MVYPTQKGSCFKQTWIYILECALKISAILATWFLRRFLKKSNKFSMILVNPPLEGWHGPSFAINLMIKFPSKYNIHIALALWNKTIIPWCFSFFLFFLFFEVVDFKDKTWKWQINTWYIARQISAIISLVHPFLQHSATVSVPHPNFLLWYLYLW